MAVVPTEFFSYVNALVPDDQALAKNALEEADVLVKSFVGENNPWRVPQPILDRAQTEVAAELYYRKGTRAGIAGFDTDGGMPFRVGVDPMRPAYPLFAPFIPRGF